MNRMIALAVALTALVSAAGELWVDNVKGDDGNPGTKAKPFRTMNRALKDLKGGWTLHLVPNKEPYREIVAFGAKHNGTAARPTVLEGHGARMTGLDEVPAAEWTDEGNGVWSRYMWNNAWPMDRVGWWCADFPLVWFDGKPGVNCTNLATLVEGGFFLRKVKPADDRQNWIYVRPPKGRSPKTCRITTLTKSAKIDFIRCQHVVVRDIVNSHTPWDCFGSYAATNCVFDHVDGSYAMDQGISAHSSINLLVKNSHFHRNAGCGICDVAIPQEGKRVVNMPCSVTYENCVIENNTYRTPVEFHGLGENAPVVSRFRMVNCTVGRNTDDARWPHRDLVIHGKSSELEVKDCKIEGNVR